MTFGQAIAACMSKYATFSGRASRSEFWWFYLFTILMSWGATIVDASIDGEELTWILVTLALLVPTIAAGSRRLHDVGRSGWWQLLELTVIGIIPLVIWWASPTSPRPNKHGAPAVAALPRPTTPGFDEVT